MQEYAPKLVQYAEADDKHQVLLTSENPATLLMATSLAKVFQMKEEEAVGGLVFSHANEKASQAFGQALENLTEFQPPLAELEPPPADARLDEIVKNINMLATQFATADGVITLELALLRILGIDGKGAVYYDPDPSKGSQVHAISAWELSGMSHLLGIHWAQQRTIINLRRDLEIDEEPFE